MEKANISKITEAKGAVKLGSSLELKTSEIRFSASIAVHTPIILLIILEKSFLKVYAQILIATIN